MAGAVPTTLGAAMKTPNGFQVKGDSKKKSKEKAKSKGKMTSLSIQTSDNGGFTAECFYDSESDGPYQKPEKHVFTDLPALIAYIEKSLGSSKKSAPPAMSSDSESEYA